MGEELIPGLPEHIALECLIRVPFAHFPTASSVCKQWKREMDSPSFHLMRRSNGQARSILALVQAEPSHDDDRKSTLPSSPQTCNNKYRIAIFDPSPPPPPPSSCTADTWQSLPPIPGLPHGVPLFCRIVAVGMQLLVIGGWDPATWAVTDGVHVYDFVSATWRRGARMPGPPRSFFAACASSAGGVVVAGGHDDGKNALRSALAYDLAGDRWVPLPDMAGERDECGGVFVGSRFYAVGGYCTEMQGSFSSSAEAFDFDSWEWGPVEEDFVVGGNIAFIEGDGKSRAWPENVRTMSQVVALHGGGGGGGGLMVLGTAKDSGAQVCYIEEEKGAGWKIVSAPAEYAGHIQSSCSFLI